MMEQVQEEENDPVIDVLERGLWPGCASILVESI